MSAPKPSLQHPIQLLISIQNQKLAQLSKGGDTKAVLQEKLELDRAIAVLQQAESLGLFGRERALNIPPTRVRTPSAAYRVMEDNESDNRELWTATNIALAEGDLVLKRT